MDAKKLSELKLFIEQCKSDPSLLSTPSLSFFRDYLQSLGAKIPTAANEEHKDSKAKSFVVEEESDEDMEETEEQKPKVEEEEEEEDEIVESDVELEGDTVEPDNDPPQKMGDASVEVTDENREAAQEAKGKAMEALSEGNFDEAIDHLTQAITLNPTSAIMYGNRASVYIKLKKPNAAIRDANAALEINPDSAKGYKARGMARAMLGEWAEAAKDLHLASTIDYDEEISAVLKKVEPNAHKLEEHRRKYDRLRKERDEKKAARDRQRRRAEAQAAYDKAKKEEQSSSSRPSAGGFPGGMPGGFPGGMPGGFPGGMPGGFPGGMPGAGGMPGGFPEGKPGAGAGGMPGGVDFSFTVPVSMDPSLSSDPHRPPQYSPFPQFPTSNSPFVSAPNLPFYGGNQTAFNSHVSQPQTQTQTQTPPSQTAPPYSELIVEAIAHLNEPEGSSKMAISRYIERSIPVLPAAHAALLAHHLKTLKNCGVLSMVKKSYKLASSSAPESVAVAAAAAAAGLAAPRSESPLSNPSPLDPTAGSASQPLKRGRGRPPKAKPETPQQLISVQPNAVQLNGQPSWEQPQFPVASPNQVVTESAKRGPGRPRKDGSAPIPRPAGMSVIMKRRGRPPGRRAAGRQRKPLSVSSSASVFPYVANGARRRGRPRRVDTGGAPIVSPAGGEGVAVAPGIKRGRGRPPKIGGVKNRLITKPKRGRGRPVGRPRKNTTWPVTGATDALESAYGELKAKLDLCNEKAKEILNVLTAGITNNDNQAVAEAAEKLEGLIPMLMVEQKPVEELQPEEAAPQTEAEEPQGEAEGPGQEREGGEEEQAPTAETQVQTDAEAMQEALF